MKRMLEKELARYKAGMNAAQALQFALMLKGLAADGTLKRTDINQLWRNITEANDRLAGAHAALNELNYKVPETDANRKRMELSARKYRLLAEKLS